MLIRDDRLRQVDVKAEHFERQVARVESERDTFEKKYEDALEKFNASRRELDEVISIQLRRRTMQRLTMTIGRCANGIDLEIVNSSFLIVVFCCNLFTSLVHVTPARIYESIRSSSLPHSPRTIISHSHCHESNTLTLIQGIQWNTNGFR